MMAPPPATPTPHRFLVPKRSQPKNEAPKAFQSGPQQFHTTPRFSLHSTPREPGGGPSQRPSSSIPTPVPSRTGAGTFFRPTPRPTDPINDSIDSSPPFDGQEPVGEGGAYQDDPIEVFDVDTDVDAVLESSPVRAATSHTHDGDSESESDIKPRSPKRRRISISSDFPIDNDHDDFPPPHAGDESEGADSIMRDRDPHSQSSPFSLNPADNDEDPEGILSPVLHRPSTSAQQQQPTFQKAPRFKPAEPPEPARRADPLPDAFSPHRRGAAKYVPGGLAASVRDWFVGVWAGAGAGAAAGEAGWAARIRVQEVRAAAGVTLITGREVGDGDEREEDGVADGGGKDGGAKSVRVVLAGSPRVVGLERGREVRPDAVVGVGRPTWEVEVLDLGCWAVVCEWAVLG